MKKPYAAPALVVHGKVAALTTSGSGTSVENNQGQGQRTKKP